MELRMIIWAAIAAVSVAMGDYRLVVADRDDNVSRFVVTDNLEVSVGDGVLTVSDREGAVRLEVNDVVRIAYEKDTDSSIGSAERTEPAVSFRNGKIILMASVADGLTYRLFDCDGRPVASGNLDGGTAEIATDSFEKGVYVLSVDTMQPIKVVMK